MKKIKILFFLFLVISCGKSPLLNEIPKESGNIQGVEGLKFFKTTSQSIQINWLTKINTMEEGRAVLVFTKSGAIFDDQNYSLGAYLWMKSMGHGSSPITLTKLTNGIYQISEMYFLMAGEWELHLNLKRDNSVVEDVVYHYNLI